MRKKIPVIVAFISLFIFAVSVSAGQVEIVNQEAECLCTGKDFSTFTWQADIENFDKCAKKASLKIDFYDADGRIIETFYDTIYIRPHQRQCITGKSCAHCCADKVKDVKVSILSAHNFGR